MLRRGLSRAGHEVVEAVNGREGLARLAENEIHLIVTDIIMPEMEGVETILRLKKNQTPLPIIAISGGGRMPAAGYLDMAKHVGANKVLSKPFEIATLLGTIDELLGA